MGITNGKLNSNTENIQMLLKAANIYIYKQNRPGLVQIIYQNLSKKKKENFHFKLGQKASSSSTPPPTNL